MSSFNNMNQQQSNQKVFKSSAVIVPQSSSTGLQNQNQSSISSQQYTNQAQFNQNQYNQQQTYQNQQTYPQQQHNQQFNQSSINFSNQNQSSAGHPNQTSVGHQNQNQTYNNMATMAMHNAPPVASKPGGVAGQNQQQFVQYAPQGQEYLQQQGGNQQQQHFTSTQQFNQQHGAQQNQQFSSQQQHQFSNQGQQGAGINVQSNRNMQTQQSGGNQYQTQVSGGAQQYSNQAQFNQHQQNQHSQNQQSQQQNYQNQQNQFNQQQQNQHSQQNQQSQQQNYQNQQNQINQQQQNLRGQQIHSQPAPRPPAAQQHQQQSQQQQHQYSNGGTGAGAGGGPSFLAKKHFQANQTNVEWKNRSMRKVERSNSQILSNQHDSDEDGHLPEFTSTLHDLIDLREGDRAHFDCCLAPQLVGDSSLKVEWTRNGQALPQDNRYIVQESFGRLSLDIIGVRQEDQGMYQVFVVNNQGQAASQASLKVMPARGFQSSAGASQGEDLGSARFIPEMIHEDQSTEQPAFTERLPETLVIEEGEPLRLQASLQPANDPLMKVSWTFNGRPLLLGSRMATFYDFGLVTLSILDVRAEDSGAYVCTARNSLGQAETRTQLTCQTKGKSTVKPMFQEPLVATPSGSLNEGDYVHLETRLEPRNDPYVIIEWYHNNRLIQTGQRLRPHFDFGIATLDIVGAYPEDTGTFSVKATNSLGSDMASVNVQVAGKPGLLLDTQHPEGLAKIADLEYKDFSREFTYNDYSKHEPRFQEQLPRLPDFNEGEKLRLEAQIEPRGDPNMKVEWFLNGRPINNGHRTRTVFDFGFASLDVLDIQTRDAGEYIIRATNTLGTAESKTFLKVIGRGGVISDAQYAASLDKIRDLESYNEGPTYIADTIQDETPSSPPTFTEQLRPVPELREGQSVHLECNVSPPNDPTMKIEWFVNGRPLFTGSRFRTFNDFGAIGLDILTVIPEDTGEYVVKVSNAVGSNTSSAYVQVKARASIILEPQAPGGAEKVRELEAMLNYKPQTVEDEVTHQAPVFLKQLTGPPGKVKEGQSLHLECQISPINDPTLRVEWFFQGRPLSTGSRCRFTHDLEYVALDMLYVFQRDAGEYTVKVTNAAGTAVSSTTVHCFEKKAVVTESLNPRALKKIQDLEAWNL